MIKKELLLLIIFIITITFASLYLRKFEFLMLSSLLLIFLIYVFLNTRKNLKAFKSIFKFYRIILLILSSIILIIFGTILYNGDKYRQLELIANTKYILILGSRLDNGEIPELLKNRLDKALECYSINKDVNFIVSGGPGYESSISEAEEMQKYLIENGINESNIILEPNAQSTFENVKFTKDILAKIESDTGPILIISNDFHIARALMISKSFNLDAYGLSSPTPNNIKIDYTIREVLAFIKDFIKVNIYKLA